MNATTVQPGPTTGPQPVIFDPVLNIMFPFGLTNPESLPLHGMDTPVFPPSVGKLSEESANAVVDAATSQILSIVDANNTGLSTNCSKCIPALSVGQAASVLATTHIPEALVSLCQRTKFKSNKTCRALYEATSFGASWAQILSPADGAGLDGQHICAFHGFCPHPPQFQSRFASQRPRPKIERLPDEAANGSKCSIYPTSTSTQDTR